MGQFYSIVSTSPQFNAQDSSPNCFRSPLAILSPEVKDEERLEGVPHGHDCTFRLPDESLASIFRFLNSGDRKNCSLVSRRWLRVEGQSRHRLSLDARDGILPFLPSLFARFDSVTKLSLRCNRKSSSISDDALILVSIRCRSLIRLKLSGRIQISDIGMATFATNCKNFKKFSCSSCTFGAKTINALTIHCKTLEELSVKNLRGAIEGDDEVIVPGAAALTLKSIVLKDLLNGMSFLPLIIGSKMLRSLNITHCHGNWDNLFKMIGHENENAMASVTEIHLEKIQVSDDGLSGISNCGNLETLHLIKTVDCTNFGLVCVAENCKRLRKLHIDGWKINRIGDEGLIAIAKQCVDLEELVLIGVNPTTLSLSLLSSNCMKLERLALCGSTAGDAEIACIAAKCKSLKKLCIKGCPISNIGIESLAWGCPNLTKIKVKKCRGVTGEIKERLLENRKSLIVNWDVDEIDHLDASSSDAGSVQEIVPELVLVHHASIEAPVSSNSRLALLRATLGLIRGRNFMACTLGRCFTSDSSNNL